MPRVVKIQAPNPSTTAGDGSRWWRNDRYVDFASRHALRWLGRNFITWNYNKFPGAYLKNARDVVVSSGHTKMAAVGLIVFGVWWLCVAAARRLTARRGRRPPSAGVEPDALTA